MPARPPRQGKRSRDKARFAAMNTDDYRPFLNAIATHADEYAGIPMPVKGEELVVHPAYKFAKVCNKKAASDLKDRERVRNIWRSKEGFDVAIVQDSKTGKIWGGKIPPANAITMQFSTMGIASAWDAAVEAVALEKLRGLIKPHLFDMYVLTGAFLETSRRSKVTYMFRRLRPTLALSGSTGDVRVLCALCLHPIGYYNGTWAGCMVPTDEVVAHLLLMRGDEPDFWRQANQHPAWRAEAGL